MRLSSLLLLAGLVLAVAACDSASPEPDPVEPLEVVRVENLPGDPTTGRDPVTGAPIATNRFTFFSLRENRIVLSYADADRADSTGTSWDLAFRGTTIIANGGAGGPGQGGIHLVEGLFDEVSEAPADGYAASAPSDWYTYNPQTHVIAPRPGRVLVVRTADGRYAKVRILSYYRDAPAEPNAFVHEARYFTFEYLFQPDGTGRFTDQ